MTQSKHADTEFFSVTWVTLDKCCELVGWTKDQINSLRTKGKIRQDIHWIKRNGRIFINVPAIQRWIETGI
jgi:hypothetical protein